MRKPVKAPSTLLLKALRYGGELAGLLLVTFAASELLHSLSPELPYVSLAIPGMYLLALTYKD